MPLVARVMRVQPADVRRPRPHAGGIVRHAEVQRLVALGGRRDLVHVLHAEGGFDDELEADALLAVFRCLDLGHQHVHAIDVGRSADLGDHDEVEAVACLFQHVDHVAVHVVRIEAIDAHREGLVAPVDIADGLDDVLAGLRLVIRRHRILKIEEHDVGGGLGRLFEHLGLAAGDGQFAAVQAGFRLFDVKEAHDCS